MSRRKKLILASTTLLVMIFALVGIYYLAGSSDNWKSISSVNKGNVTDGEVKIEFKDKHPDLKFSVNEENAAKFIKLINLDKELQYLQGVDRVEVTITDDEYEQMRYTDKDGNLLSSTESVRDDSTYKIKIGFSDLERISTLRTSFPSYVNSRILLSTIDGLAMGEHNGNQRILGNFEKVGVNILWDKTNLFVIEDIVNLN